MRRAGSDSGEQLRAPTSAGVRGRSAASHTAETVRAAGTTTTEPHRPAGQSTGEQMLPSYVREHPPVLGCSIFSIQGVAGVGTAGCMVAGLDLGYRP